MSYRCSLLGFILLATFVSCNNVTDEDILKRWEELENSLQVLIDNLFIRVQPILDKYFLLENISSECMESLRIVFSGIRGLQTWALKFVDSTGIPMTNVLSGSLNTPGLFDECINIVVPDHLSPLNGNKSKVSFRGQYCSIEFRPLLPPKPKTYFTSKTLPEFEELEKSDQLGEWNGYKRAQIFYFISFRTGICVPSSCSRRDIGKIVDIVADNSVLMKAEINHCEVKEYNVWTREQIIATVILGIPITLSLVGTCVTVYLRITKTEFLIIGGKAREILTRCLKCFSVYINIKSIFNTENTEETLTALHGMRFLSLAWVILGHTYYFANFKQLRNLEAIPSIVSGTMFQIVLNATVSVDTFFFMSGLLVVYVPLKKLREMKKKTISIPLLIFHRIWRLWPPLLTTILFLFFVPWIGSGPYWHETIDPIIAQCKYRWWITMIFANNFLTGEQACLTHTWFLSCDFQLYLFAVFILIILLRRPVLGFIISATLAIIGMIVTGYLTKSREFPPTMLYERPDKEERINLMNIIYFRPYTHGGVYWIGMVIGYLLQRQKRIIIKPILKFLAWITAIACNLTILFATSSWNRGNYPAMGIVLFYSALHRTIWGIGLAWLTFACCTGNCEIIRKFLSWGAFVPLSRLSYFAYLIHYVTVIVFNAISRQSIHGQHIYAMSALFTNLTVTYLLSLVASVFFESPFLALERIMFSARKKMVYKQDNRELKHYVTYVTETSKDIENSSSAMVSKM